MAKLFFAGDSITAGAWDVRGGWANRIIGRVMEENINRPDLYCMPYNIAVSGDAFEDALRHTLSEIEPRLYREDDDERIQIVVALGINDSCFFHAEEKQRFSDEQFRENIEAFITQLRTITSNISFIGLTAVDEEKVDPIPWASDRSYKNAIIQKFESIIQSICTKQGLDFLPMFNRWVSKSDYKEYLIDGVHPNTKGHEFIAEHVERFLLTDQFYDFHKDID